MHKSISIFVIASLSNFAISVPHAELAHGQADATAPLSPTSALKIAKCPVTPNEDIDPEVFTEHEGKRICFCCDRCRIKFRKEPAKYLAQPVSDAAAAPPATEHGDAGHGNHIDPLVPMAKGAVTDNDHKDAVNMPAEHDHKEHGPAAGKRWQKWLGGFHPAMVNFPIGVLTAGAIAETLFIVRRRQAFDGTARFCVMFATLTGVAAGILGWLFGGIRLTDTDWILATHRWLGTATVVWMLMLWWVCERAHRTSGASRTAYRVLLFGGTALVSLTGFFGGAMVYGIDHYLLR